MDVKQFNIGKNRKKVIASFVNFVREYRVTMAEELRNLPIQGDYITPPP